MITQCYPWAGEASHWL